MWDDARRYRLRVSAKQITRPFCLIAGGEKLGLPLDSAQGRLSQGMAKVGEIRNWLWRL